MNVQKINNHFIVSQHNCWVDGFYASERAARMACSVEPSALYELSQVAAKRNAPITEQEVSSLLNKAA